MILFSDLADDPTDLRPLGRTIAQYEQRHIPLRVVALDPKPEDRDFWTELSARARCRTSRSRPVTRAAAGSSSSPRSRRGCAPRGAGRDPPRRERALHGAAPAEGDMKVRLVLAGSASSSRFSPSPSRGTCGSGTRRSRTATAARRRRWSGREPGRRRRSCPGIRHGRSSGIDDDLEFRRLYVQAATLAASPAEARGASPRGPAEAALGQVSRTEDDPARGGRGGEPARRSFLHGSGSTLESSPAERAIGAFQVAVLLDPSNESAKGNLELILRQLVVERDQGTLEPRGRRPGREGRGAGLAPGGKGY